MDYFSSKLIRGSKYALSIIAGAACVTVITLGGLGISTVAIPICGGIALIPIAFLIFDHIKVIRDVEKLVSQFENDIDTFRLANNVLRQTKIKLDNKIENSEQERLNITNIKNKLLVENARLESLLGEAKQKIQELHSLINGYQETTEKLRQDLKCSSENVEVLKTQTEDLLQIKEDYEVKNKLLNNNYKQAIKQLEVVTIAKDTYEIQLQELSNNNNQLINTTELLKAELNKTQSSYEDAKSALKTLLQTSAALKDLGKEMVKTEEQTEDNVGMMGRFLNMFDMTRTKVFKKINKDTNQLSIDELVNIILDDNTNNVQDNI